MKSKRRPATGPGEFPDCGCHYTTDDDGIHFCTMHKAAPDLLAACELSLKLLLNRLDFAEILDEEKAALDTLRAAAAKARG